MSEPTSGIGAIATERQRQITEEGYTPDRDERNAVGQFVSTAIVYLGGKPTSHTPWPVKREATLDGNYSRRNLVKAGALIAAAIDRLDAIPEDER